jgi:serine/threonine protein kinase
MDQPGEVPTQRDAPVILAGRYTCGPLIGTGGSSQVFRATDGLLGREVAVKVFSPVRDDPASAQRQEAELRILASLSHPHLVTVYDAVAAPVDADHQGPICLVMELMDGPPLSQQLRTAPMAGPAAAALGHHVADALSYVHAQGIVHRDVKPANLLFTASGVVKLGDFGIAITHDGPRHTSTGQLTGTAAYLSPEQVLGHPVGPPSDVYSLGLVLLEALTGHREYDGPPVEAALARLSTRPALPDSLPPGWPAVLDDMTATDPEDRPTAAEVSLRLSALAVPASAPAVAQTATAVMIAPMTADRAAAYGAVQRHVPAPRDPATSPRRRSWIALGAGVVIVAAVAGLTLSRGGGPAVPPTPHYAPVTGPLGTDLINLEHAVRP